ncbi:MAG TPA: NAD-dependent epimerase/dehydratase family protein [Ignavibacteriaceae bacterium]|nr:NAD-dependent epimerase/dehydratase family protein [Ignavibacteriaceae bacterium]
MKIFIIGGTGFISKNIVDILLERGHDVTIFTRGKSKNPFNPHKHLHFETGNRNNESDLKTAVGKNNFDAVYDMVSYTAEQSEKAVKIIKGHTGRFVHCSTVSVYMVSNDVQCPITEDQDKRELMVNFPLRNPFGMDYGINKRKCEDVLWEAHNPESFPVTMLRPAFVCGPEDKTRRDFFWIQRILDGKPLLVPGSGDFAFQQVYKNDTAKVFCNVIESDITIGEAYNVASEEIYSLNEYIFMISKILNKSPELVHIDQEVFDNLDISYYPGADVFPFNTRRTVVFSLDKIKNHIGYKSTPFKEWMPVTINWYRKNVKDSFGYSERNRELEIIRRIRNKEI